MKSDHRSNDIRILSVGSCPAVCGLYLVLLFVPSDKEINSDYPEPEVDVNMDLDFYPNQEQDHWDIYDEPKIFYFIDHWNIFVTNDREFYSLDCSSSLWNFGNFPGVVN